MAVGKSLGFELVGGSRDLFGSQFHCSILFDWVLGATPDVAGSSATYRDPQVLR